MVNALCYRADLGTNPGVFSADICHSRAMRSRHYFNSDNRFPETLEQQMCDGEQLWST